MSDLTVRERLLKRNAMLVQERASWITQYKEISEHIMPRSGRFFSKDRNNGERKHNKIYDSTGTRALRTLGSGMQAGANSPARPWMRMTTSDPKLDESPDVKRWLSEVGRLMMMIFARSNTYRALHVGFEELGAFGTEADIVLPDYQNVIHHYPLTCGEYCIATDHRGVVNTLYREFEMTIDAMVGQFGIDKVSATVKNMYDSGNIYAWVPVIQAIEPRINRDATKRDSKNMPFSSIYFEPGGDNILQESGFKQFRALCPRWSVSGGDIYGNSPAMEALGDIKQLQHEQLRKAQGIDYRTKPPLQGPTSLKGHEIDGLPGGVSFVDAASPTGGIRALFESSIDLSHLLEDIRDVRQRINSTFYADMFLMLANADKNGLTATEVAERHEEKLIMLGPVLERVYNEKHSPLIEMTFSSMVEAGLVPPAPEELQGKELNVEFVSMLAQAQKAIATSSIDRLISHIGTLAVSKQDPSVWDKYDMDRDIDTYSDMLGVDPELIVSGKNVALIRDQRAKVQQQQAQTAQIMQASQAAKNLGSINTAQPNALTDATRAFSGYT